MTNANGLANWNLQMIVMNEIPDTTVIDNTLIVCYDYTQT